MTESDKLVMGVETEALLKNTTARESWRIFGIMSEFVEATERLAAIRPAVTIFGSARVRRACNTASNNRRARGRASAIWPENFSAWISLLNGGT